MTKQDRRTKEGRGQGSGEDYIPYNKTQHMHGRSNKTRAMGQTTGRMHHLATNLHLKIFTVFDYSSSITDIQEEFPLPLEDTVLIAQRYELNHPKAKDGTPKVITTDFRLTVERNGHEKTYARAVRTSAALSAKIGLHQLEIQRRYFQTLGIDWGIITEIDFPEILAENVKGVFPYYKADDIPIAPDQRDHVTKELTHQVQTVNDSLSRIATELDTRLGLQSGCSMSLARHLIATRKWRIDLYRPLNPVERLILRGVDEELLK